ncbi:MAG: hypothetical protein HYX26_01710 [Acidobacteriales bacterium]|nr:hypothetical protein [Terriglobales bacterium]
MSTATHHDAEIVLRLYELRREPTMRKARDFMTQDFWPRTADDVINLSNAWRTEENAYFRQITTWCEMCATLPLSGAVNSDLFADWNGEILFLYAKFKPLLPELREKLNPGFLGNTERFVERNRVAQERVEKMLPRIAKMAETQQTRYPSK